MGAAYSTPIVPSVRGQGNHRSRPLYARTGTERTRLLFQALDEASRYRKLSDAESETLERCMRTLGMI